MTVIRITRRPAPPVRQPSVPLAEMRAVKPERARPGFTSSI